MAGPTATSVLPADGEGPAIWLSECGDDRENLISSSEDERRSAMLVPQRSLDTRPYPNVRLVCHVS